jgi:hypothetical protein
MDGYGVCRGIPAAGLDGVVLCGGGGSSGGSSFTTQLDVAVGCASTCCTALMAVVAPWLAGRTSGYVRGAVFGAEMSYPVK